MIELNTCKFANTSLDESLCSTAQRLSATNSPLLAIGADMTSAESLLRHLLRLLILNSLLGWHTLSMAQDLPPNVENLNLDNASFDAALFIPAEETTPSWLEPFSFKLSQQLYSQINDHHVRLVTGATQHNASHLENNRFSLLARYQNPFASGWLLQGSAQAKLYGRGDYEYRANNENIDTEFRLNELFLQRSSDKNSLKFGAQTVVWGENEGNSVLDVINTSEFRDLTIIDIEDARLPQWLLVWDRFGNNSHLSSFVNLYPEFNPAPVRGSPFFIEPTFNLTDYKRKDALLEIGSRLRWSFTGSDIAVMAAYLYENQLRYEAPSTLAGDAISRKNDFVLLGLSANRAIGKLLLKLDVAYSHDITADIFVSPVAGTTGDARTAARQMNQLGTSAGFEYALNNEQNISLGVTTHTIPNARQQLGRGESLIARDVTGNVLLRYTNSLRNGEALLAVTVQSALEGESILGSIALNYTLSDHFAVMTQLIATRAEKPSPLTMIDDDLRLGLTFSWSP